jgi:two-component system NtrC family sensor kinase
LERRIQQRTAHLNTLLDFSKELFGARSLDAVLQRALTHAMALVTEVQSGAIYLAEDEGQRLALRASHGFSQLPHLSVAPDVGLIGQVFTTGRPLAINSLTQWADAHRNADDEEARMMQMLGLQSVPTGALLLPLSAYEQVVGVLVLLRQTGEGNIAADARLTLSGLANLTAAAILEAHNRQAAATLSKELAQMEEQQRSLTERLNYVEAGMLQAARLAAVGQLAASIAHEINNPLYAARNGLYLIEDDLPEELRSSPYLRMVSDQLARIAGIIERMRDFYRPTRGELAPADINQLLEETLALAGLNSRHGGINMIFTPAQELPLVQGNADQLRQVFLNLVLNAIEAMPNGGTLTVRTEAGPSVVLIEIQDTGVGIPDDIRPHLFEPFFTNKPNGTGLGLSISAHIVTQHGGHIDVESAPGQGTTFRLVLPYQSIVR